VTNTFPDGYFSERTKSGFPSLLKSPAMTPKTSLFIKSSLNDGLN